MLSFACEFRRTQGSPRSQALTDYDPCAYSPADINPDPATMNYACVVAAGVWAFSLGYYYMPGIGGKTFFRGPVTTEYEEAHLAAEYGDIAIEADVHSNGDSKRDGKGDTKTTVRPLSIAD